MLIVNLFLCVLSLFIVVMVILCSVDHCYCNVLCIVIVHLLHCNAFHYSCSLLFGSLFIVISTMHKTNLALSTILGSPSRDSRISDQWAEAYCSGQQLIIEPIHMTRNTPTTAIDTSRWYRIGQGEMQFCHNWVWEGEEKAKGKLEAKVKG